MATFKNLLLLRKRKVKFQQSGRWQTIEKSMPVDTITGIDIIKKIIYFSSYDDFFLIFFYVYA